MKIKGTFESTYDAFLGLFALVMLVFPKMIALFFIVFVIFLIVGLRKKKLILELKPLPVLFAALYVGYTLYSIATRHPDQAAVYIENKLSFLLLPVLLSFRLKIVSEFKGLITGFTLGVFILISSSLIAACVCYLQPDGGRHCFLASEFSFQHHPSYSSAFYILALVFAWYGKKKSFVGFNRWTVIPFTFLIVIATFMSLSLAGILFFFSFVACFILWVIYQKFGKWIALSASIVAPFLMYLTITSIPQVEGEWTNAKWFADEYLKDPSAFVKKRTYPMSGTEVRIVMWTVSTQVFQKYPMGVGTGNVDEVLADHLNRMEQQELAKQNYNPHNQYLQTGIEIGIFGLLILIAILVNGLWYGFKHRNWILVVLTANLFFNMLFESMLQRQSGIVFYTFFLCILVIYSQTFSTKRVN